MEGLRASPRRQIAGTGGSKNYALQAVTEALDRAEAVGFHTNVGKGLLCTHLSKILPRVCRDYRHIRLPQDGKMTLLEMGLWGDTFSGALLVSFVACVCRFSAIVIFRRVCLSVASVALLLSLLFCSCCFLSLFGLLHFTCCCSVYYVTHYCATCTHSSFNIFHICICNMHRYLHTLDRETSICFANVYVMVVLRC